MRFQVKCVNNDDYYKTFVAMQAIESEIDLEHKNKYENIFTRKDDLIRMHSTTLIRIHAICVSIQNIFITGHQRNSNFAISIFSFTQFN